MTEKLERVKKRLVREANDSLDSSKAIVTRLVVGVDSDQADIQAVRSAANQARQAAMNLDQLCGLLEAGLC